MTEEIGTPISDSGTPPDATAPDVPPVGTDVPVWTPPPAGRLYVPAGASVPEGWYEPVGKRGLWTRARSLITRRVPVLAVALALLVGLGIGGGVGVAATDGHRGDRSVIESRGGHDGSEGPGRSGR